MSNKTMIMRKISLRKTYYIQTNGTKKKRKLAGVVVVARVTGWGGDGLGGDRWFAIR